MTESGSQKSNQDAIRQRESCMSPRSHCHGSVLRRARTVTGALVLGAGLLGGTAIVAATPASAIPIPPSTSSCTYNGSPVAFGASNITGTPVTVNCTGLPPNTLLIVAQTSPLAGVISPSSAATWAAALTGAPNAAAGVPGFFTPIHGKLASNTLAASPAVYCFKNATAPACAGLPVGTLIGPHLSGTIAYPRSATVGHKEVVALEPNTTPAPGNGPNNTVRARAFVSVTSP